MEVELSEDDRMAVGWAWTTGSPTGLALRERHQRGQSPAPTPVDLASIRREWDAAGRPAPDHHLHRATITLPDGTELIAASFFGGEPYARDLAPAYGLYLDACWDPPWPHEHLEWEDFGLPDADGLADALARLLERARTGTLVEIGCLGGHGRTGTALACLAVMTGFPPTEAAEWVRGTYCSRAVETPEQRAFVECWSPRA